MIFSYNHLDLWSLPKFWYPYSTCEAAADLNYFELDSKWPWKAAGKYCLFQSNLFILKLVINKKQLIVIYQLIIYKKNVYPSNRYKTFDVKISVYPAHRYGLKEYTNLRVIDFQNYITIRSHFYFWFDLLKLKINLNIL